MGGRKHILVTSYGKKIPVDKIEASLKTIECVKDALLVGNNQPYCSAVIWVDKNEPYDKTKIAQAIDEINKGLEGPAQIKRFEIVEEEYSKTPEDSLKIKRQDLLQKAEKTIELIYSPQNASTQIN